MTPTIEQLLPAVRSFLQEDLGTGDLTRAAYDDRRVRGHLIVKQPGVVAGQTIPAAVFQLIDPTVTYTPILTDGAVVAPNTIIGDLVGSAAALLAGERVLLNLMQRMSGIATATHAAVDALNDASIGILDTRKTAPGLRVFDKYAVQCGGGRNHRMGLYDAAMLKDNHWRLFTDLPTAVTRLRRAAGPTKLIEVEVETPAQLATAVNSGVDMILIDNQLPETVRIWRQQIPRTILVEASGGITATTLPTYAHTGVDYISLGYLTNATAALDISLELAFD